MCGVDLVPRIDRKRPGSKAWQGIKNKWEDVRKGLRWKVGNGRSTRFWKDTWLPQQNDLLSLATQNVPEEYLERNISDFIFDNGSWNLGYLKDLLPQHDLELISSVEVDLLSEEHYGKARAQGILQLNQHMRT